MAKYDSSRKVERNRALYEYHVSHPELSLREIAKPFNISKARAGKIIEMENKKAAVLNQKKRATGDGGSGGR